MGHGDYIHRVSREKGEGQGVSGDFVVYFNYS